jgi:hypothetical protein
VFTCGHDFGFVAQFCFDERADRFMANVLSGDFKPCGFYLSTAGNPSQVEPRPTTNFHRREMEKCL